MILTFWWSVAATVLTLSTAVHASTFFGVNPKEALPGVMLIHVMIFPPVLAAIFYSKDLDEVHQINFTGILDRTPGWMQVLKWVVIAYTVVNFVSFISLNEGGVPQKQNGKYFLMSHGKVVRELTTQEYERQEAYEVRGFSGHWIVFSFISLQTFTGVRLIRREKMID